MTKNNLKNLNGQTIIVTGSNGYIGAALVRALLNYDVKILCLSKGENKLNFSHKIENLNEDIVSFEQWEHLIKNVDVLFHFAAQTSLYDIGKHPTQSIIHNILPVSRIIEAAQKSKNKIRVIFPSTASIYGLGERNPISENFLANPLTYYDLHKYFVEQLLIFSANKNFIETVCFRLSNVYGYSPGIESSPDRGVLNKSILKALNGDNLEIYGDGDFYRDFIYIDDVVSAFMTSAVVRLDAGQFFNLSSGESRTLKNAFETIINKAKKKTLSKSILVNHDWPIDSDQIEKRNYLANINKFSKLSGWKPRIKFDEGVELTLNNFLKLYKAKDNAKR